MEPKDVLGNTIKPGQLVLVRVGGLGEPMLAQVVDVKPGGIIGSTKDALPVMGQLVMQIIVPMNFSGREPVQGVWVLEQPQDDGRKTQ